MAEKREKIMHRALIVAGLIATVFSFVYYFKLKHPNDVVFAITCLVDLVLCIVSLLLTLNKDIKVDRGWHVAQFLLIYFGSAELIGFFFVIQGGDAYTFRAFANTFLISLFLSPSILLMLPAMETIVEIIAEVLSCP